MAPSASNRRVLRCARSNSAMRSPAMNAMSQAPSPTPGLDGKKTGGEARTQRRQNRRAAKTFRQDSLQHEQDRRRGHVAEVAQHVAFHRQRAVVEIERRLDGSEHFR